MSKVVCHQKGRLFIKCKNCGYSWNTNVIMHQEVDDTCPNCTTDRQHYIVITPEGQIQLTLKEGVDIPEFMSKPKEVATYEIEELKALTKLHYDLGKQKGLSQGITIGLIILGITLFLLFAPMTVLPG